MPVGIPSTATRPEPFDAECRGFIFAIPPRSLAAVSMAHRNRIRGQALHRRPFLDEARKRRYLTPSSVNSSTYMVAFLANRMSTPSSP